MGTDKNGNGLPELERRLWAAADQLWANSSLRPAEYSGPVLGFILLRIAGNAFTRVEAEIKGKTTGFHAIGKKLNEVMNASSRQNDDLKDVLAQAAADAGGGKWLHRRMAGQAAAGIHPVLFQVKCEAVYQHIYDVHVRRGVNVRVKGS